MMTIMLLAVAFVVFAVSIVFMGMSLMHIVSTIPHFATINHRVCLSK